MPCSVPGPNHVRTYIHVGSLSVSALARTKTSHSFSRGQQSCLCGRTRREKRLQATSRALFEERSECHRHRVPETCLYAPSSCRVCDTDYPHRTAQAVLGHRPLGYHSALGISPPRPCLTPPWQHLDSSLMTRRKSFHYSHTQHVVSNWNGLKNIQF